MSTLPESLFTAAQVREMDRIVIEEKGIPGIELMRRAGAAVFTQIRSRFPQLRRLLVCCGAGNNAGDGYVIARLALQAGYSVQVVSLVESNRLHGDAATAYQEFLQAGGQVEAFRKQVFATSCLIVDALLGTGLDREVGGVFAEAVEAINASGNPSLAVDIPSGLHADTGRVMGNTVKAVCTVTFIGLKQGLFTGEAAEYCGDIVFSDLAVPADVVGKMPPSARLCGKHKLPARNRCAHKGHYGHVLLIGGDSGYSGAIGMAAKAALRSGAGLVSVATRAAHNTLVNCTCPEIMSHGVESVEVLQSLLDKASVVVIGPGLGQSDWAKDMFAAVSASAVDCVADADALNLLAVSPQSQSNRIITPHPGEAARLLKCSTKDIMADRFAAVSELQRLYGGVALLKGAGTLIKGENDMYVSTTGNPGMATGGMGDVLSGIIAALRAQRLDLETASRVGVYTHGEAADMAAAADGERGMLATDLLPMIRKLLN